jgi:hypothetical protein
MDYITSFDIRMNLYVKNDSNYLSKQMLLLKMGLDGRFAPQPVHKLLFRQRLVCLENGASDNLGQI